MITPTQPKNNRKQSQIANRLRVLRLIYSSKAYSQRGIVLATELQASTISNIISEFLKLGIIVEGESIERGGVGPRETALRINPKIAVTVGINLHATTQDICLIDSSGAILSEQRMKRTWGKSTLAHVANKVRSMTDDAGLSMRDIKGVGLAVPGIVDAESGVTVLSRALQVENYPIRDLLAEQLQLPVLIDRNVNFGSYLEQHFNPDLDLHNSGYLLVSKVKTRQAKEEYSVGMCLNLDGKVYRGANHAAGELDAVLLPAEEAPDTPHPMPFFQNFGNHFASVINLLDLNHLIIVSEENTLSQKHYEQFSKALKTSLIPFSNRSFSMMLSDQGIRGIAHGAGLKALHQYLEARLGESILNRSK